MAAQGGEVPWSEKYRPRTLDEVGWAIGEQVLQRRWLGGSQPTGTVHMPAGACRPTGSLPFPGPPCSMLQVAAHGDIIDTSERLLPSI